MDNIFQKRAEKISQAVYLVTSHLKDNEPLKWELRKDSISFLSCSRSIGQNENLQEIPSDLAIESLSTCAQDIISLLSLSLIAGLISNGNARILINEIESLISNLRRAFGENTSKAGFILSDEFFRQIDKGHKGQNIDTPSNGSMSIGQIAEKPKAIKGQSQNANQFIKDKKDSRVSLIISLLKQHPNSTIKDFAKIIPDVSEKTIQRELLELVEKGIIRKEGERRWSRYSLN